MNFDLSQVEFSKKDIKNNIKIPKKLTPELAYFIGIHLGDGCLSFKKEKYDRTMNYTGHFIDEYDWYTKDITLLIKELFNKNIKYYKGKNNKGEWLSLYFHSKAIFTFLNKVIGLPIGSKNNCSIPDCIKNSNLKIKCAFIKGFADTDFCLTFKKRDKQLHYYPVIEFSTCNRTIVNELTFLLQEVKISSYSLLDYPIKMGKVNLKTNQLHLNGIKPLKVWMEKIGFNSPKHLTKYLIWKKYGFCPPNTNLTQRKDILDGKLDINKIYKPKPF